MRVVLKESLSLSEAYSFSDEMTMKGCEILELSPTHAGCRVLIKLDSKTHDPNEMELSESLLSAYLGLNNGKTKSFISLVEFQSLQKAFEFSKLAESQSCLVHEIRALRGIQQSHHMILSHDSKDVLDRLVSPFKAHTFSKSNKAFCEFLGFSDVTIEG